MRRAAGRPRWILCSTALPVSHRGLAPASPSLAAELLSKAGRKGDAEAHLQRAFEKEPSLELYKRLCNLGGDAARQRAVKFLDEAGGKKIRWHNPSDLLIRICMHEKMFEAAWATVRKHGASMVSKRGTRRRQRRDPSGRGA